jgi:hypothetical protein
MFLHSLDVCRLNSYIIAKTRGAVKNKKDFIIDWICSMNHRAEFMEQQRTRSAAAAFASPDQKPPSK